MVRVFSARSKELANFDNSCVESDAAIETGLTLRSLWKNPLRTAQGLLQNILDLMPVDFLDCATTPVGWINILDLWKKENIFVVL